MYGLVNKAIQDLVINGFGEQTWLEICEMSGFDEEDFVGMEPYPDSLTYTLVANISKKTGLDSSKILELFGEHWILYTADEGYGDLMNLSGSNFVDFLNNLNLLHERISNIMPKLEPPDFKTRNQTDRSIELEYRSSREGLIPMLHGLIKGLGKRFNMELQVEQIEYKNNGAVCDVFRICW
jgi:hypothetical protein